jgi:hypothetical protein
MHPMTGESTLTCKAIHTATWGASGADAWGHNGGSHARPAALIPQLFEMKLVKQIVVVILREIPVILPMEHLHRRAII